jgi:uncharacterized protein (TIGR02246 family)
VAEQDGSSIEERLRAVEDQLAIYQVVARYVYAVDGLNADAVGSCYTEEAVYRVGDLGEYRGREEILGIVTDPGHGHIGRVAEGVAHLSLLPHVVIDGDRAVATVHMVMARHGEDGFDVWRLSASRISLARQADGAWRITDRQNHLLDGAPAGPGVLAQVLDRP